MKWGRGWTIAGAAHSGLDHSGAFADPADTHSLATKTEFDGDLLWPRITRHDCFGGLGRARRLRTELNRGFDNPGADLIHGQRNPNPPSGTNQRRPGREVEGLLREPDHLEGVGQTLLAGAGIRIARIDNNGLRRSLSHALRTDLYRRGAYLVCGEHPGDCRGDLRYD